MKMDVGKKNHHIKILREIGFNCFPVPRYPKTEPNQKANDGRYNAESTKLNQPIGENENYAVIPIKDSKTTSFDLDDKERFRVFAEKFIDEEYNVVETPNGWRIYVQDIVGVDNTIGLWDYNINKEKPIFEIFGCKHSGLGAESIIFDENENEVKYEHQGADKIYSFGGRNVHTVIEMLCTKLNLTGKELQRGNSYHQRKQFQEGKMPAKGSSNTYFFNAALQCNTNGLTREKAYENIREMFDKWMTSSNYSHRPWSNIETTINNVYDGDMKIEKGAPKKEGIFDGTVIAMKMIAERKMFSDIESKNLFEDNNGFLEKQNRFLQRDIQSMHPEMKEHEYKDVIFKLVGLAKPMPETNRDLFVFKNGKFNRQLKQSVETDELADMGFKDYDYLEKTAENEPTEFIKVVFDNAPKNEHPRIKAALRAVLSGYLDPRISIVHGKSRVGKSTFLLILVYVLGSEYAVSMEYSQLVNDAFIKAKTSGKRLLVIQDMPKNYKDWDKIKALTGEGDKMERGFQKDAESSPNKLKIMGSANYVPKFPEEDKDSAYTRLSVIHNKRKEKYAEDATFANRIAKDEGEKIISWILNLSDEECSYEDFETTQKEWEDLASPEIAYLERYWQVTNYDHDVGLKRILDGCFEKTGKKVDPKVMISSLKEMTCSISNNIIRNIEAKTTVEPQEKESIQITIVNAS